MNSAWVAPYRFFPSRATDLAKARSSRLKRGAASQNGAWATLG